METEVPGQVSERAELAPAVVGQVIGVPAEPVVVNAFVNNLGANLDDDVPDFTFLPTLRFDVTNYREFLAQCYCCPSKVIVLKDSVATIKDKTCCSTTVKNKPYANFVMTALAVTPCLCCAWNAWCEQCAAVGLHSDFNGPPRKPIDKNKVPDYVDGDPEYGTPIFPGCGCQKKKVRALVEEINDRRDKRGNMAQMRRLQFMSDKIFRLATQFPVILHNVGGSHTFNYPPQADPPVQFEQKIYDVTPWYQRFHFRFTHLILDPDEVELKSEWCGRQMIKRREYVHIGDVTMKKDCICKRSVDSDLSPPLSPGCGCEKLKVAQIVQDLKHRMGERGSVGQIRRAEKMFQQFIELEKQAPKLMEKMGVAYPPDQATMNDVYRRTVDLDTLAKQGVVQNADLCAAIENGKKLNVTNKIESCCTCCRTCGCAGCPQEHIEFFADHMVTTDSNKIDGVEIFTPYAQMDNLDVQRERCCYYQVNDMQPGWGCFNGTLVREIAAELQSRKVKRGDIAQLKEMEAMQNTAALLNYEMDLILKREGILYPPTDAQLATVYGGQVPKYASTIATTVPHIEPSANFPTKVYDVTNIPMCIRECLTKPGACITKSTVTLEPEEMVVETKNCCFHQITRTPYAVVDSTEFEQTCCCCVQIPDVAKPGCGCSKGLVKTILADLNERIAKRGDVAQLKMQENITFEMLKLDVKTDLLIHKRQIAFPPPQETMSTIFGSQQVASAVDYQLKNGTIRKAGKQARQDYGVTSMY